MFLVGFFIQEDLNTLNKLWSLTQLQCILINKMHDIILSLARNLGFPKDMPSLHPSVAQ